eukprot:365158-Chlamydomonas_euryale.AAC.1
MQWRCSVMLEGMPFFGTARYLSESILYAEGMPILYAEGMPFFGTARYLSESILHACAALDGGQASSG